MGADSGASTRFEDAYRQGLDAGAGRSPRGPITFLDAALTYYAVFDNDTSDSKTYGDGYEQVNFSYDDDFSLTKRLLSAAARRHASQRIHTHYSRLRSHVFNRYSQLKQPLRWTPRRTLLRDKFTFVLGVSHIITSAFWLGHSPSTFYKLYTLKALLLFALRFFLYRREKMHYYLLDFCYYANMLLILQVWMYPEACQFQTILFAYSMGPLAWSIPLFRNSMIFHSLDKMTSVFLHAFPPLVVWSQRWYPPDPGHWQHVTGVCEHKVASVRDLVLIPWMPYAIWAVAYYLKIFVISSSRIQNRGYQTLYLYLTKKPNSVGGKVARALPHRAAALLFMCWHIAFCAVTFLVSWLMWQSFWLHTGFIIAVLSVSTWNGGNYYFEVFARKYLEETGLPGVHGRPQSADLSRPLAGTSVKEEEPPPVARSASEGALQDDVVAWDTDGGSEPLPEASGKTGEGLEEVEGGVLTRELKPVSTGKADQQDPIPIVSGDKED